MGLSHSVASDSLQPFVANPTVAHQAPPSMGFSRQEYWSGLPFPPPGDLPNPGIKPASPVSPALQADSLPNEPSEIFKAVDTLHQIQFLNVLKFLEGDFRG